MTAPAGKYPIPDSSVDDSSDYAQTSAENGLDCWQALERADSSVDKESVVEYYRSAEPDRAVCHAPLQSVRGLLAASIKWPSAKDRLSRNLPLSGGRWAALQILPSVTIGVPVAQARMEFLRDAFSETAVFAGFSIRYTPSSYLYSINLNFGVASGGDKLDKIAFPDPRIKVAGIGLSVLGAFEISVANARLTRDGLWHKTVDSGYFVAVSIDAASLLVSPLHSLLAQK